MKDQFFMRVTKLNCLVILVTTMSLCACSGSEKFENVQTSTIDSTSIFLDNTEFGTSFSPDTKLFLNAQFSECGEWGGHEEKMVIYVKDRHRFYLNYTKFKVKCEVVDKNNGSPIQQLDKITTILLTKQSKTYIANYLHRMLKSKTEERFPGHAGNIFSAVKSDSTLLISIYDSKVFDVDSYNELLKDLKLN